MRFSSGLKRNYYHATSGLDRGLIGGMGISIGLVICGVAFSGSTLNFISPLSLALVLGGTIGATLAQFSPAEIRHAWTAFKNILIARDYKPLERIGYMVRLAQLVRRDGLLALEYESQSTYDQFLKTALELTVDAQDPKEIKRILETEIRAASERSHKAVKVFEAMGGYAPAMGLIGTLIGLIQMLSKLEDPATVGPAMALALVTTLYGAVLANAVFLPIAGKLRNRADEDSILKAITVEGVLGIGRQENPIVVEQRLQSFMPLARAA